MKCPYCNEKIPNFSKECPICCEHISILKQLIGYFFLKETRLKTENSFNKNKECGENLTFQKTTNKNFYISWRRIIITIIVLLSSFCIIILFLIQTKTFSKINNFNINLFESTYKFSDEYNYNALPSESDINQLFEAEIKMSEFFEQSKNKSKNNQVFIAFLNILYSFTKREYEILPEEYENKILLGNLQGKYINVRTKSDNYGYQYECGYYEFANPEINSIFLTYAGEGFYDFLINYKYLYDKYSQYLSIDMQEYLAFKSKQIVELDYSTIFIDGYLNVGENVLKDWILYLQNFIEKYPNFILQKDVNEEIWAYTENFMWNKNTFDINTNKISTKSKNAYLDFLKQANKNTEEYKIINEAFTLLENNNFENNETFENLYHKYQDEHPIQNVFILK